MSVGSFKFRSFVVSIVNRFLEYAALGEAFVRLLLVSQVPCIIHQEGGAVVVV